MRERVAGLGLEAVFDRNERVEDRVEPIKHKLWKASEINNNFTQKRLLEEVLNAVLSVVLIHVRRIAQRFVFS